MTRPAPLALLMLLAACGPLVQIGGNAPPPDALLTLRSTAQATAGAGRAVTAGSAIAVEVPLVPGALQTLRLPVTIADTQVQYLTKASWAEQPARLFQRVLVDTLAAGGATVLDPRAAGPTAGRVLSGTLREFGLDVRDPAAPVARVRYDATLTTSRGAQVRRFEASAPAAAQSGAAVAAALNAAANQVAADVAGWVGS